jgi:hypothetical protein
LIDWHGFRVWVDREFRPKVANDRFRYAEQYSSCLLDGDFSKLLDMKTDKRCHVLAAISALAKFLGLYGDFKSLVSNYGLKWTVRNDDLLIARLTKTENPRAIFDWINDVKAKCPELTDFMDFMTFTGLRYDEGIESYNLIIKLAQQGKINEYFNAEKGMLEHFRFKEIFIRRTKKAFISFASEEILRKIAENEPLNIHSVQTRVKRKCGKLAFSDIREMQATLLTKRLNPAEIDFLQGRVSGSVFMRHYFNPALISDLKERVFKGIAEF